jgi:alpha-L-rhamnosidase
MTRFMAWRLKADPELKGVKLGNTWGDWLNVNEDTPIEYVDLCYHGLVSRKMAEMAAALGKDEEAANYRERLTAIRASFATHWCKPGATPDSLVPKVATQSAYVLALSCGMIESAHSAATAAALVARIQENGNRMATGFLGTKPLLGVLTATGNHDLACRLFQSRKFPSWGYEVEQGATSVWERWDSFTKEHGFDGMTGKNNAAMNSFSHYAFGAVMEWAVRDLAGIDLTRTGFRSLVLRPSPPSPKSNPDGKPISWIRAEYRSPTGLIRSAWKREGTTFSSDVTVPPNTLAEVHIPTSDFASVREGGRVIGEAEGVRLIREENGHAVLGIGSGEYQFTSTLAK